MQRSDKMIIINAYRKLVYKFGSYKKRARILRKRGVIIGKNSEIQPNTVFGSEPYLIELGDNVRIISGVQFMTHDGGLWVLRNNGKLPNSDKFGKIKIGNNVHIGTNSIILPGITIGDNVIIGAGAVVTKDIPSNSVAVGVPARVIETIDEYYEKNKDKIIYTKNLSKEEKKKKILESINKKDGDY